MMTAENLNAEVAIYEREKERLLHEGLAGKFALIGQGQCVGVWDTYEDALQAGYSRFGIDKRFLVRKIEGIDGIQFFSRDITACRA